MSLFLGKIHFWLFDKIKCFEDLENEIISFADKKGEKEKLNIVNMFELIGQRTEDKNLEDMIDTNNIHGWLQDKIQKAEKRQAYLIKNLKSFDEKYIEELKTIFENHGSKYGKELSNGEISPKQAYETMNNFVLEGMPCDRTTDFLEDSDNKFSYSFVRCLHKKYWDELGADIRDFYNLRNAWIKGFIHSLDSSLDFVVDVNDETYVDIEKNIFSIIKK